MLGTRTPASDGERLLEFLRRRSSNCPERSGIHQAWRLKTFTDLFAYAAVDALIAAGTLCLDEGALRMAKERRHAEA